eukprot:GHVT01089429.1.p1 GENE.GHVT01089429.1~~GHVT01089429.1.p1  ORF type:complete len:305 (-),score=60.79 GHVT01089429.1:122-1036(-)
MNNTETSKRKMEQTTDDQRKASKQGANLKLGTHNGRFHCDEVMGMVLLTSLPEFAEAEIVRTRDETLLATCDVVIDVGGVHDAEKLRFDHHQREFNRNFDDKHIKTKLSSAGLVFQFFGKRVLKEVFGMEDAKAIDLIHLKLYENLFESIDANDNGVSASPTGELLFKELTSLPSRVARCNPNWVDGDDAWTPEGEMIRFRKAMEIAKDELKEHVELLIHDWYPARAILERAFASRSKVHASCRVLELDTSCPWEACCSLCSSSRLCSCKFWVALLMPLPSSRTTSSTSRRSSACAKTKRAFCS